MMLAGETVILRENKRLPPIGLRHKNAESGHHR